MKVALDLRPLQIGHQFRGIGICLQNILKQLPQNAEKIKNWDLSFYVYKNHPLPEVIYNYPLPHRVIKVREITPPGGRIMPLRYLRGVYASWRKANSISRLPEIEGVDVFVQFDFLLGVPSIPDVKSILFKYDLIPLVLEPHYLPTHRRVRTQTGSLKLAVRATRWRARYWWMLNRSLRRADLIVAISEQTKRDLVGYMRVDERKIKVLHLAADDLMVDTGKKTENKTLWAMDWRFIPGQMRYRPLSVLDKTYLLYIGGTDHRRRIQDLVSAYNLLRAGGTDCALVLVGYDFQGLNTIPNADIRRVIEYSSYGDDIYLLGFVSPADKSTLYKNALAFVYPTLYEGFGLPILEAMQQECPVICYDNSSLREVGGTAALYTKNPEDIADIAKKLLRDKSLRQRAITAGRRQAKKFSWQDTTLKFIEVVKSARSAS